jgi:uncharacterized repeat protein (TIGR01451 family)
MKINFTLKPFFAMLTLCAACAVAKAQLIVRPYTLVYSENLKGGTTMFGNTILNIVDNGVVNLIKMNETADPANGVGGLGQSQYGNDEENTLFIDIDGTAGTINSSSADLVLPAGTNTIKFARMYWGGRIDNALLAANPDTLRKIKIRKGTSGVYTQVVTPAINVDTIVDPAGFETVYQSFVDITQFINALGAGTYTVADIPVTDGIISSTGGHFGGWSIVVAYENPALQYNSIRIYDGYARVFDDGFSTTLNVTLTGLNVPNNALLADEAVMSTMAWEGDANLGASAFDPNGDFLRINDVAVSNTMNPVSNFWNGSVTKNGINVTTKDPNYSNQMGIDIDEVNVGQGYNILPNATTVTVEFGTEADQYFPSAFTFAIRMKNPFVVLDKAVTDANGTGFVDANEELTYTLSGSNAGPGTALNAFIVDSLPVNVTYVPNSLQVLLAGGGVPGVKTDAQDTDQAYKGINAGRHFIKFFIGSGATGTTGGQLVAGAGGNYSVQFKVKAGPVPGGITNTGRITAASQAGDTFTDDGTAVIGTSGGPIPVKFTAFNAVLVNNRGLVKWATESELDNDHFEVERSEDGVHFIKRAAVNGSGSTSISHSYQFYDELNVSSAIVYYRLRIVDLDGRYGFSKIVAIKLKGGLSIDNFSVFPNPFVSDLKVGLSTQSDAMASFRILSFDGKELMNRAIALQKGDNIVVLKDLGALAIGNYILEVRTPTGKLIKKIMKSDQ